MTFKVNTPDIQVSGTGFQGYIYIPYEKLVKKLGNDAGSGDKTQAEWFIQGEVNGKTITATIYDWKNYGFNVENITEWHIGGFDADALKLIRALFPSGKIVKG